MLLPGKILEEIRDALISGFPTEEKFKNEILSIKLNIEPSKYPNGENYEGRVYNCLRELDAENRIIELIKASYEKNKGNPNLEKIYRKIPKISLLVILYSYEKKYFEEMKKSYYECFCDKFTDWEPQTVEEILDNLDNLHQEQADRSPMVKFVAKLLNIEKFPEHISDKLKQWGQNNNDNFDEILEQTNQQQKNIQRPLTLLILIEPSLQGADKGLYLFKSWLIESEGLISKPKSYGKILLNISCKKKEKFSLQEIPSLLKHFIDKVFDKLDKEPTAIEFFLPRELFNQPIDTCIPKKFEGEEKEEDDDDEEELYPVGMKYHVSIRSYQRIKKLWKKKIRDQKIKRWELRWETLYSQRENVCFPYLISGDNSEQTKILSDILLDNILGVKLFEIPCKDILKAIDSEGIPVALWLRNESKNSDIKSEFEAIFQDCSITKMPKKIIEKRRQAFRNENHIGKNIVLLWDNPNILPPEILPASLP